MPKNKFQGFIFGIIMSYAMAYGMEVYNIAIKEGVNLNLICYFDSLTADPYSFLVSIHVMYLQSI